MTRIEMRCATTTDKLIDSLLTGVLPESLRKFFVRGEFPLLDGSGEASRSDLTTQDNGFPQVLEVPVCKFCL